METVFICPVCHNQDARYLGFRQGRRYCRRCLPFHGETRLDIQKEPVLAPLDLKYELTEQQKQISQKIIDCYHRKQSVLIDAVTGSGKTEIVLGLIQVVLAQKQRIAFVVPRKDVVIELFHRFQSVFPTLSMQALYGGQILDKNHDFYVMTTHQVYQFHHQFDAMILDESDAFPYEGNPVLHALFLRASKGFFVLMSATFSSDFLSQSQQQGWAVFQLFKRYHGHPLPIPQITYCPKLLQWFVVVHWIETFQKLNKQVLVFVPTTAMAESLFFILKWFLPHGSFAHSHSFHRDRNVQLFKDKKLKYLIATSILERGITLKHLQVIIVQSDHPLMDEKTLIQMAGRVGRKIDAPEGKVIYLAEILTESMEKSIQRIRHANASL
jgi:competence protein ComFA